MYQKAIEILKIFNNHNYLAYIVGGYPRDFLLGIKTKDIDICTNAKPKEIIELFGEESVTDIGYGAVKLIYKNGIFDVTTFRHDIKYENNRKPVKIKYVNDLKKDLLRRDFTINTICIDGDSKIIDLLDARTDLDNRLIKTVGNPRYRIKEDVLRILRAIRFAAILDFEIDEKTKIYIKKYGHLLKKLSNTRKKEELDKIFMSVNKEIGKNLLIELGVDKYLGLCNLREVTMCDDLNGIWSQIETNEEYPYTKLEQDTINKIKEMSSQDINKMTIYKYGLYISTVVGSIKGIEYKEINDIYNNLPIKTRKEIEIDGTKIASILKKEPGNYIKDILEDIEIKIIDDKLENKEEKIIKYIKNKYI